MNIKKHTTGAFGKRVLLCLLLSIVIILVYFRVGGYEFINYDDDIYVTDNFYVKGGMSIQGVLWAFTLNHKDGSYWQPLTWMSHMLDCEIFGLDPGKHHLHSLGLHILNCLLLFLIFTWMTDNFWQSAFLAALFALHPVNVDSVVWVSQRKSVLSTFFFLLSLAAYVHYTRKPEMFRYLTVVLLFALGVLAKPMLISMPFVLLLLDYWPLKRCGFVAQGNHTLKKSAYWLILEKVPLFLLTAVFTGLATSSLDTNLLPHAQVPMSLRVLNLPVSYIRYIGNVLMPYDLSIHYPYPIMIPLWLSLASLFALLAAVLIALRLAGRYPYGIVFLLWFMGTLVPVSGLIQAGLWPAIADRWLYIPAIGLFGIISWMGGEMLKRWSRMKKYGWFAAGIVLSGLAMACWQQVGHWVDSEHIFKHAIAATDDNLVAHNNLGNALLEKGRIDDAMVQYFEVLRIKPDYADTHNNLGAAYFKKGDRKQAMFHFKRSIELDHNNAKAHNNLGVALSAAGNAKAASERYQAALRLDPYYAEAYNNLGLLLLESGRIEDAVTLFKQALKLKKNYQNADMNLKKAKKELQHNS